MTGPSGVNSTNSTVREPDEKMSYQVLPVPPLDAGQPGRVVYLMMRFDAVLDVPKLRASLESLLAGGDGDGGQWPSWRRLGARLRRDPRDGRLEYHVPERFSPAWPAVAFSHDARHAGVDLAAHPLGRHLRPTRPPPPSRDDRPYLVAAACDADADADALDAWMRPPAYPDRLEDFLGSDAPLLGVHAVSLGDATIVTLAWLHTLSDVLGVRELLAAWVAVLEGRPRDVRPVNDVASDWWLRLERQRQPPPPTTKPASGERAEEGNEAPATAALDRRFVCFPAAHMRRLAACAAADLEAMRQPAEDASGGDEAEGATPWVSSGDLASALIVRICLAHSDPPPAPDDAVRILNAASVRQPLEGDLIPVGIAYVGNMITAARAQLQVSDVLTKPLAHTALAIRHSIQQLMRRETLVPLMAALAGRPAGGRVIRNRGQGGQSAAAGGRGQTDERTWPVFVTNWSKGRLYDTDFSAAVVPRGPDLDGRDGGRPSFMLWNSSGPRMRNTAIVVTDPHGNLWWSCQLPKEDWAKLERNLAEDAFEDS